MLAVRRCAQLTSLLLNSTAGGRQQVLQRAKQYSGERALSSSSSSSDQPASLRRGGFVSRLLDRETTVAGPEFNRWWTVPGAVLVHLGVGTVYSWSIFNLPLTRELGVVAAAADDWTLSQVMPVFSTAALAFGLATWFGGSWVERVGPRKAGVLSATCMGGGLAVAAAGCALHSLPLLYLGYGVGVGVAWGVGYLSPISALIKWFPDRRGMATSLAVCGFGGGAFVATPLIEGLLSHYKQSPVYLGSIDQLHDAVVTRDGRRFVAGDALPAQHCSGATDQLYEVVVASASEASAAALDAGVYLVSSGCTGTASTFATMAAIYFAAMTTGAFIQRVPRDGWMPPALLAAAATSSSSSSCEVQRMAEAQRVLDERLLAMNSAAIQPRQNVHHHTAVKTPQFYLLWSMLFSNAMFGVSLFACAKTIMTEVFSSSLPLIVTGSFAASYVGALSAINLAGRLCWGSMSDHIGRKRTYLLFGIGAPITAAIPYITAHSDSLAQLASALPLPLPLPLLAFCASTALLVSFYGGTFALLPAMLADVFGPKHASAIHGRVLTAWGSCAFVGPLVVSSLRARSYDAALHDLASKVDPLRFEQTFGATVDALPQLAAAKSVTIRNLLDIAPPGTIDPTPMLYNSSLYTMAGFLALAFVANASLRPVASKHFIKEQPASPPHQTN